MEIRSRDDTAAASTAKAGTAPKTQVAVATLKLHVQLNAQALANWELEARFIRCWVTPDSFKHFPKKSIPPATEVLKL
jgi:hypothetical protein